MTQEEQEAIMSSHANKFGGEIDLTILEESQEFINDNEKGNDK